MNKLNLDSIHPSWMTIIETALKQVDPDYKELLIKNPNWLPGPQQIFNAFTLPLPKIQFILFGESPYPRVDSANGYAFWDARVERLWSDNGLSKTVNRATSLRNWLKMLLVANSKLRCSDTTQQAIANLDKRDLIDNIDELFMNMQHQGILLLNASLVLSDRSVSKDAAHWLPFVNTLLAQLALQQKNGITLILLGKIAQIIDKLEPAQHFSRFYAEHPYNISFITNPEVIDFFQPMNLLAKKNCSNQKNVL